MRAKRIVLLVVIVLALVSPLPEPNARALAQTTTGGHAPQIAPGDIGVSEEYGERQGEPFVGDAKGMVIVIEESHPIVRVQENIANMLKGFDKEGLNYFVALEGPPRPEAQRPIDYSHWTSLFAEGEQAGLQEAVAWTLLEDATISAAEYAALTSDKDLLYGIENVELYQEHNDVAHELEAKNEQFIDELLGATLELMDQLITDLASRLTPAQQDELFEKIRQVVEGEIDLREFLNWLDPWLADIEPEGELRTLARNMTGYLFGNEVREDEFYAWLKVTGPEWGVPVPGESNPMLALYDRFLELVDLRDAALVTNTVEALQTYGDAAAVMIIGAAHTPGVTKYLSESGVSHVVFTPHGVDDDATPYELDTYEKKRQDIIWQLLDEDIKPYPSIDQPSFHRLVEMKVKAILMYRAWQAGTPVREAVENVNASLAQYPLARVEFDSIDNGDLYLTIEIEDEFGSLHPAILMVTTFPVNYRTVPEAPILDHGRLVEDLYYQLIDTQAFRSSSQRRQFLADWRRKKNAGALFLRIRPENGNFWLQADDRFDLGEPITVSPGDADAVEGYVGEALGPADPGKPLFIVPTKNPLGETVAPEDLRSLSAQLSRLGYTVYLTEDPGAALDSLSKTLPVALDGERNYEIIVHRESLTPEQLEQITIEPTLESIYDLKPGEGATNVIIVSGEDNDLLLKDLMTVGRMGGLEGRSIFLASCGVEAPRFEMIRSILKAFGAVAVSAYQGIVRASSVDALLHEFVTAAEAEPEKTADELLENATDEIIDRGIPGAERLKWRDRHVRIMVEPVPV